MPYKIATYETESGKIPVRKFLNDKRECPPADAARIQRELKLLRKFGHNRIRERKEYKPIHSAKGIYELRVGNYRLFFSCCREDVFMFYHIYKKTNDSNQRQDNEISVAQKRMIEYQRSGKCQ
jgi:mRNA-degrading endonuclease RelE of RelBE toxin-antitoxin system